MEEYKVGEVFQFGKIKLRCVLGTGCNKCFFSHFKFDDDIFITKNVIGPCDGISRSDKNDIIFVKVEEDNE